MKPVVLSFITEADIDHLGHGFDSKSLRKKAKNAKNNRQQPKVPIASGKAEAGPAGEHPAEEYPEPGA